MMTEREKQWLEKREKEKQNNGYYFCAHSELRSAEWNTKTGWADVYWVIETKDDFRDAAEFEARVAAKLVSNNFPCRTCTDFLIATKCPITTRGTSTDYGPFPCLLRQARLAVEEEMPCTK